MEGICGWSHSSLARCLTSSTVLLTPVQEGRGSIGSSCPCQSLGVSRSILPLKSRVIFDLVKESGQSSEPTGDTRKRPRR